MKPKHSNIEHVFAATSYSFKGLKAAWKSEMAFRQEVALACLLIPAALFIGSNTLEILFLILLCISVLVTELINSALEAIVDRIGEDLQDIHPLSGAAKDMGSAAVFLLNCFTGFCYTFMIIKNLL